jgi:hypothetical protein
VGQFAFGQLAFAADAEHDLLEEPSAAGNQVLPRAPVVLMHP